MTGRDSKDNKREETTTEKGNVPRRRLKKNPTKQKTKPQELHLGKNTVQLWGCKSFVQGWSGSKLKAKHGYRTTPLGLLAAGGRERKAMGKVIFASRTWLQVGCGCHKAKSPKPPRFLPPRKRGNSDPKLMSETCSLEHQAWGKGCSVSSAPPLAPGNSVCPAVLGPIAPMRAAATGCLIQWDVCRI